MQHNWNLFLVFILVRFVVFYAFELLCVPSAQWTRNLRMLFPSADAFLYFAKIPYFCFTDIKYMLVKNNSSKKKINLQHLHDHIQYNKYLAIWLWSGCPCPSKGIHGKQREVDQTSVPFHTYQGIISWYAISCIPNSICEFYYLFLFVKMERLYFNSCDPSDLHAEQS